MKNENTQLRLSDVIHSLYKHRIMIAVLTVIGLSIGIVLSIASYMRGEMSREYAVTSAIAVTSQTQNGLFTSQNKTPNSTDIYLAENMVDSVIYVLKSDKTLNAAINKINLIGISSKEIAENLSLSQYKETQIIELTLYWRSAEEGVQILSSINNVAPGILINTLKLGSVSVVNEPTARYRIGGNVNMSLWIYMALLGLIAGIGFSVLNLLLQPTLVNTRDLESMFGLEILGEVPQNRKYFTSKKSLLVDDEKMDPGLRESFASTAHILHNRLGSDEHQCLYITSSTMNEGKTNIAAHLAVQLSDLEHKVLLIDFDVRNPSLGTLFLDRVDYEHSLNALFRGETTKEDAITNLTAYLDLLPAMLERHELPLDEAMLEIVRDLAKDYDYVLMDTAPVGRVADTMNLNRIAKNAIFVVRYDSTNLNDVRDSLERLDKSGIHTMGCIINGVRKLGSDSYYGNYGYYKNRKSRKIRKPAAEE